MTPTEAKKVLEQFERENYLFRCPKNRAVGTDTAYALRVLSDSTQEFLITETAVIPVKNYIAGETELRMFEANKKTRYIKIIKETFYYCGVLLNCRYSEKGLILFLDGTEFMLSKTIDKSIEFIKNNRTHITKIFKQDETNKERI